MYFLCEDEQTLREIREMIEPLTPLDMEVEWVMRSPTPKENRRFLRNAGIKSLPGHGPSGLRSVFFVYSGKILKP